MKHFRKVLFIPLLIGMILSCEQKNEIKIDRVTELTNQALSSIQFASLKIKVNDLNIAGSKYADIDKTSIMIPFVGRDDRKGLIALFDENDGLRGIMEFEALTSLDANQIYHELKNGTFRGTFVFRIGVGKMSLELENSKVIASSMARMDGSAMAFKCYALDETGGALDCAGARLENMSWIDTARCTLYFLPCMAYLIADCIIDGCTVDYV